MEMRRRDRCSWGYRSRRETFERALRAAALRHAAGSRSATGTCRRCCRRAGARPGSWWTAPRLDADLVVDASGRAGRATRDLGRRVTTGGPCGQAYVDRVYRLRPGATPGPDEQPRGLAVRARRLPVAGLPARAGLLLRPCRPARRRPCPDAACATTRPSTPPLAAIPGLAEWTDPERVDPGHRRARRRRPAQRLRRSATTHGRLVLPGLFFVGDSVATTTPVFGRGLTTTLRQVETLMRLVDQTRRTPRARATRSTTSARPRSVPGSRTTSCWTPPTWTGGTATTSTSSPRFRPT